MRLVLGPRGTVTGTEIESGEPVLAGVLAARDAVEPVFHMRGELVIHVLREFRLQKFDDGERQPGRNQRTAALVHVSAVDDRGNDAGIGGWSSDFLLFQFLDQRRFGIPRQRLGLMAVRVHRHGGERITRPHRRQGGAFRLRVLGFAVLGVDVRGMAHLARGLHESREADDRAGCLEHRLAVRGGRRAQTHGRGGAFRIGHLAGERATPDQRIQPQLVRRNLGGDLVGIAEVRAGGPDAFVRLLRARHLRRILLGLVGKVPLAEMLHDGFARGLDRLLGKRHRIGTHIGDETILVQPLRGTHGLPRTHAETVARGLLQRRCGERGKRTTAIRLRLHGGDGERRGFQRFRDGVGPNRIQLDDVVLHRRRSQLAVRTVILGTSQTTPRQRHHARVEQGVLAVRVRRLQRGGRIPIRGAHERHALTLALDDQTGGDGLHASSGKPRPHLAPQHRGKLVTIQTVQNTTRFLGVDQSAIHIARVVQ